MIKMAKIETAKLEEVKEDLAYERHLEELEERANQVKKSD